MTTRPDLPLHIDATIMSCFRSCHRKMDLEFIQGFRLPGISVDLHAGACFATALEAVYKATWKDNLDLAAALQRGCASFFLAWGDFEIPEYKRTSKTSDRVWEAVEAYFRKWPPRTDHIRPYFAADGSPTFEYTFAIPLEPTSLRQDGTALVDGERVGGFPFHPSGSPFLYSGRFDMLGQYEGRPVVRDEKTTGKGLYADWAKKWSLRSQFMGYVWACQQCGIPTREVVVRGIPILKLKDTEPEECFVEFSDFMLKRWHEQLRRDMWKLRRCWDEGYFDYNFGETCTAYGLCPFMDVCQSQSPETWTQTFEVRHWNPLNKNPTSPAAE
jgi:hypothetical protein